ncbi:hypothetical protein ILUMI_14216 [Ignelater luminosus]|uniref:Uncharacterized protein n=1 Tax=Ignelater luminosus TaxID=2038154 RepID=A0A8K0CQ14_IGNLU|nr:hypothetical protein ILUMI_16577 [Ignelater luminosus]KAF2891957.1 hypothetical protein ILUMI_14216 [Ignelater luminosus]
MFFRYHGISTDIKDGKLIYRIHFIDTIGADEKALLRQFQYSKIAVFILCFAINDKESYSDIQTYWIPELRPFMVNNPLLLVGKYYKRL